MMLFDRKLLLLPLAQADRTLGSVCVEDPVVVSALTWLFEEVWEQANPIGGDDQGRCAAHPEGPADGAPTELREYHVHRIGIYTDGAGRPVFVMRHNIMITGRPARAQSRPSQPPTPYPLQGNVDDFTPDHDLRLEY